MIFSVIGVMLFLWFYPFGMTPLTADTQNTIKAPFGKNTISKENLVSKVPQGPKAIPDSSKTAKSSPLNIDYRKSEKQPLLDKLAYADYFENGQVIDFNSQTFILRNYNRKCFTDNKTEHTTLKQMRKQSCKLNLFLPEAKFYLAQIKFKPGFRDQQITLNIDDNKSDAIKINGTDVQTSILDLEKLGNISGYHRLTIEADKSPLPSFQFIRFIPITGYQNKEQALAASINTQLAFPPVKKITTTLSGTNLDSISLKQESALVYHLYIPNTTRLLWRMRINRPENALTQLTFLIRAICPDKKDKIFYVRSFSKSRDLSEQLFAIDLSDYAEQIIRLEFLVTGGEEGDRFTLIEPTLENYMPTQQYKNWTPPENVILFVSDTLRWDKIHFVKPDDNVIITPNFDKIASEGIVFTNAISQGNWSIPSQAAIMGGRYPFAMKKEDSKKVPPKDTVLIADAIKHKNKNIITASYSSNGYVSDAFGFAQQWDYSRNMVRENLPNRTEYLLRAMFKDFEKDKVVDKPFFVWLGTIDPHVAYNPKKPFLELYDKQPYHGKIVPYKTAYVLLDIKRGKFKPSKRDWERLLALYHGEISYNDHHMGVLLDKLEEWKIKDDTAIILVSDHGDSFLEHGDMGHGSNVYDELVRVPLIIYYPKGFPRPKVVDDAVETMSIYPTILDMLKISPPEQTQAESLLPYAFGMHPLWPKLAFCKKNKYTRLVTVSKWRMIMKSRNRRELYNYKEDPYQQKNLAKQRPDVIYYLSARYAEWRDIYK